MEYRGYKTFAPQTLGRKLLLSLIPIIIFVVAAAGFANFLITTSREEQILREQANETVEELSRIFANSIYLSQHEEVWEIGIQYQQALNIASIIINDTKNKRRYAIGIEEAETISSPRFSVKKTITLFDRTLGYVEVWFLMDRIGREQKELISYTFIITFCIIIAVCFSSYFLLKKFLAKPFSTLIKGVNEIANGSYEHKVAPLKERYMNMIGQAFNDMVEQIALREKNMKSLVGQLEQSEKRHRQLLSTMKEGFMVINESGNLTFANPHFYEMFGKKADELSKNSLYTFLDEKNSAIFKMHLQELKINKPIPYELTWVRDDEREITTLVSPNVVLDTEGKQIESFAVVTDITELKKKEELLLENKKELIEEKNKLEEMNTALKILLNQREKDIEEVEDRMLKNLKKKVIPFVAKLKSTELDELQDILVDLIESHLEDVTSEYSQKLGAKYANLSYMEIQVVELIRFGKSTKEIATILNISERTVDAHREHIRKKLGLTGKKVNLKSYLLNFK